MKYAIYDLNCAPVTFDFCNFLAVAKMISSYSGEAGFRLLIQADRFRNVTPREQSYSLSERIWRLENLILEIAKNVRALESIYVNRAPPDRHVSSLIPSYRPDARSGVPYLLKHVKDVFEATQIRPRLFAPSEVATNALKKRYRTENLVTVTLRNATFDASRNMSIDQWRGAISSLRKSGAEVALIIDQDAIMRNEWTGEMSEFVFTPASFSLDLRLALMSIAKVNLISAGGMAAPLWYSDIPYVMFNILHGDHYVASETYFNVACGLSVGDHFSWALPSQKLEWIFSNPEELCLKYVSL